MKKSKIIAPALGVLVLSTAASISGTVAWFTANNSVAVTGMQVSTSVGSNLLIKADTLASVAKIDEADFVTSESGSITALLEPVSTTTAKSFFYTTNAKANGDAAADDYVAYNAAEVPTSDELTAFNNAYTVEGAVGYVDYVFQLRAVNTQAAAKDIKLTKLDMYYSAAKDAGKAYRAAVLVEDITSNNPAGGSGTLRGIYAISGANNQTANYAVSAAATAPTALASNYNVVSSVAQVPARSTGQYKVVVRLWLEGEDTTCTSSTYANLNGNWKLDLELKIEGSEAVTAASAITRYTTVTTVADTKTYVYDGTSVYLADANGKKSGNAIDLSDSTALNNELKEKFGIA